MLIFLTVITILFFLIRVWFSIFIARRYPGFLKVFGLYILTLVTGIFIFFPACIFLGNEVCWDLDVTPDGHRTVLLISSAILLFLCGWVWVNIFKSPKLERDPGNSKMVTVFIISLAVIVGLIIIVFGTSKYWAPLVGQ